MLCWIIAHTASWLLILNIGLKSFLNNENDNAGEMVVHVKHQCIWNAGACETPDTWERPVPEKRRYMWNAGACEKRQYMWNTSACEMPLRHMSTAGPCELPPHGSEMQLHSKKWCVKIRMLLQKGFNPFCIMTCFGFGIFQVTITDDVDTFVQQVTPANFKLRGTRLLRYAHKVIRLGSFKLYLFVTSFFCFLEKKTNKSISKF